MRPQRSETQADPSRTGAVWVTGTGAFLLLVAAAVFVAVRWDDIPAGFKLGAIGALTGGFIAAAGRLRKTLPATASALHHLGAFLIPIDVAALAVRADLAWGPLLLAEGVACSVAFPILARVQRSVVLGWASVMAGVLLAAGAGAVTPLPAAPLLAGAAVVALRLGRRGTALSWALIAGGAPALAAAGQWIVAGRHEVLEQLGLAGHDGRATAIVAGGLAAFVLATVARRRHDAGLALVAVVVCGAGLATSWVEASPGAGTTAIGMAAVFLAAELAALALRDDDFWHWPSHLVAVAAEIVAVPATLFALLAIPLVLLFDQADASFAVSFGILAGGWLVADLRRGEAHESQGLLLDLLIGGGWAPATFLASVALIATVAAATSSPGVTAISMVVVSAVLLVSGRPIAHDVMVLIAPLAVAAAAGSMPLATVVGLAGALLLAEAAALRNHVSRDSAAAFVLAAAALVPIAATGLVAAGLGIELSIVLAAAAGAAWLVALVTEPGDVSAVGRVAIAATLAFAPALPAEGTAVVASFVAVLAVFDAARLDQPALGFTASVAAPIAVGSMAIANGVTLPDVGVAMCVLALVTAGLAAVVDDRWRLPFLATVALSASTGTALASASMRPLGDALLLVGGVTLAAGIWSRRTLIAAPGALAITAGIWLHLVASDVHASEAYVAPVSALLLAAGLRARRFGAGSWEAYAAPVALLGGAATVERLSGGAGWHALVAGAVGVAAVAGGGMRRLSAPLLLGTGLLLVMAAYESLAVTAGVPTWAWLGLGGTVLLGAGVGMERADTGPIETGRRVVDVLRDSFA